MRARLFTTVPATKDDGTQVPLAERMTPLRAFARRWKPKWKRYRQSMDESRDRRRPAPDWIEEIVKPMATEVRDALYPDREVKVSGPAGICARAHVDLVTKNGWHLAFNVEPDDLDKGEFGTRDYSRKYPESDCRHFKPGTIGEANGMNYVHVPMPKDATGRWFLKYASNWREPARLRRRRSKALSS